MLISRMWQVAGKKVRQTFRVSCRSSERCVNKEKSRLIWRLFQS